MASDRQDNKSSEQARYTVHLIGHGHIDPTWLWRWTEGYEAVRATFRSALDRMDETPGFVFTASSACFYDWVKSCDPSLFEEIRARVKDGRWEIAGGWWIEPDCNIPGGEAIVRQGLYGQRFFEREFSVRVRVGFNPDSFGHAGTFPQLYRKMGIEYYAYQRPEPVRERAYPGGTTFWWRAKDGSQILACNLLESYNADEETFDRIQRLPGSPHMNPGQTHFLCFFGVGNHGGGPTKRAIAQVLRAQKDKKSPNAIFSSLEGYFQGFLRTTPKANIPTADGDLQYHAQGCYTAHAETKRLNRRAEHELMAAERFACAAAMVAQHPYPQAVLEQAWKDVLYNQFHDVLAGTSVESSYDDSRNQVGGARHRARVVMNESIQVIGRCIDTRAAGNTLIVFNPLPWPVRQAVTAPPMAARSLDAPLHVVDEKERPVMSQPVAGEYIGSDAQTFVAEVPALGYRCYHVRSGASKVKLRGRLEAGRDWMENEWWRLEIDPSHGHICRLVDKQRDIDVLRRGNVLAALVDSSDTWGHGYTEYRTEAGRFSNASLDLLELGNVRAVLRVQSRYGNSAADQLITIYRDIDTIDCLFRINWQEQYTMLKLGYETWIGDGAATYDTAYGCEVRNTRGSEEPGQKWFDLTGRIGKTPYGLTVLNDCKYGFDVLRDTMRITLLRSPAYAHHDPVRFDSSLPYAIMDQGWHTIRTQLVPHAGAWESAGVARRSWELNEPLIVHGESAHRGGLGMLGSFLSCDAENVALTVLKKAEDGGDYIIRGYETSGKSVRVSVALPFAKRKAHVMFGAHEIKTIRFDPVSGTLTEVNLLEERE